jgi:hypothetical protein
MRHPLVYVAPAIGFILLTSFYCCSIYSPNMTGHWHLERTDGEARIIDVDEQGNCYFSFGLNSYGIPGRLDRLTRTMSYSAECFGNLEADYRRIDDDHFAVRFDELADPKAGYSAILQRKINCTDYDHWQLGYRSKDIDLPSLPEGTPHQPYEPNARMRLLTIGSYWHSSGVHYFLGDVRRDELTPKDLALWTEQHLVKLPEAMRERTGVVIAANQNIAETALLEVIRILNDTAEELEVKVSVLRLYQREGSLFIATPKRIGQNRPASISRPIETQ